MTTLDYKLNVFLNFLSIINERKYYFIIDRIDIDYMINEILIFQELYKQDTECTYEERESILDGIISDSISFIKQKLDINTEEIDDKKSQIIYEEFLEVFKKVKSALHYDSNFQKK